ncbi:hypothetical protein MMC07_001580 [Pseudocyphellaria aurata]|nr:hypothetical protein [Pseudocyphellaria aurata]
MNHHAASLIFKGYESAVMGFGEDFVDFRKMIKNVIECSKADACLEGDDWENALFELGASSQLVNRILDPHWKAVRLCRTAKEWIWFVVSSRLEYLELLDSSTRAHQQRGQPMQVEGSDLFSDAAEEAPSASSSQLVEHPQSRATSATSTQNPTAAGENSQVFYKGGLLHRLRAAEGPNNNMFPSLTSTPPVDFHPTDGGFYLTKYQQTAWEYARMTAHFVDGQRQQVPVGILSIRIPVDLLTNSYTFVGDEWRSYVWANRRGDVRSFRMFTHLQDYDWLQGPICAQATMVVQRLTSPAELQSMRSGNTTSHQIWTRNMDMLFALEEKAQPTIRVEEIHPGR